MIEHEFCVITNSDNNKDVALHSDTRKFRLMCFGNQNDMYCTDEGKVTALNETGLTK
jgi:hypothetical protein